jgi:hypothetical protein
VRETSTLEDLIGKKKINFHFQSPTSGLERKAGAAHADKTQRNGQVGLEEILASSNSNGALKIPQCGRNEAAQALAAERVSVWIVTVKPAWQLLLRQVPGFLQSGWFQGSQAAIRFTIKH